MFNTCGKRRCLSGAGWLLAFVVLWHATWAHVFTASVAFAQESEGQGSGAAQNVSAFIETHARQKLNALVNSVISKRLHPSKYAALVATEADGARVAELLRGWGDDNVSLLRSEIKRYDYFELRELLGSATIRLRYANTITASEWKVIEDELRAALARGDDDVFEQIEASADTLSPDLSENLILLRAREQRRQLDEEYKLKTTLEETRSQLRQRELQREFELRKDLNDQEKSVLEAELQNERQKRFELADVFSKDFSINDYLVRQFPVLARFAAVGSGVGALLIIGLLVLGVLLVVAAATLGKHLKHGVHEIALALKGDSKSESDLKALAEKGKPPEPDEQLASDNAVEFEHKPQLKEAADKLRSQVERDTQTTAVVLSKVAEEEKFGEVIAIFDILGPDLARIVFNQFTSMAKKSLQRAFYESEIKRPSSSALFNRINELRAMLATTDVMMAEASDKEFAQIVLAYPDEEIATALVNIPVPEAVSLLSRLPADRMLSIIRSFPKELAEVARTSLGRTIRKGIDASVDSIRSFVGSIMDEARLRFEENKRFLKGVIDVAPEEEAEAIISGLNFDPKLLLEVIGIRATMEDLWSQTTETIETLFSGLELESVVGVLFAAPGGKQDEVINSFPERKQLLSRDILDNLRSNAEYLEKIQKQVAPERKKILAKLGELAKAGTVVLPSYERLKAEVARQEELEKNGESYEDYYEELRSAG